MGRIVVPLEIRNANNPEFRIVCDALVDTGLLKQRDVKRDILFRRAERE